MSKGRSNSVLITGADRGLGLGFTKHYLDKGDSVVVTSRRSQVGEDLAELVRQYPERLHVLALDVSDESSIAEFAENLKGRNASFGIVISNAGVTVEELFGKWTTDGFATNFLVNTVGPALLVQAIEPFFGLGTKVIQISSGMGSTGRNINPENGLDAYAVSKCGLNMLSRRLAEKLRPRGVAVLSMDPGWVKTDMGGQEAPITVDEAVQAMTSTIDALGMNDTGSFVASDGSAIPW